MSSDTYTNLQVCFITGERIGIWQHGHLSLINRLGMKLPLSYMVQVTVCESHSIPGGAAHAWVQNGYHFESGPSLYSGMAARYSSLHPSCG